MNKDAMFSSASCEWETPMDFFDRQDSIYHFDLDVCATPENAKCAQYYTEYQDGLAQTWTGRCWMNPPYGRAIGKWDQKAYDSVRGGGMQISLSACFQHAPILRGGMITA